MNPIIKNILAFVAGVVIGGIVNGGLVSLGALVVPPPVGVDPKDIESIRSNMHLYGPKHFIVPYLSHALGSLLAAFIAVKISNNKMISILAGSFFIIGGVMMLRMIPDTPTWFAVLDLISYIPAAMLGWFLGRRKAI